MKEAIRQKATDVRDGTEKMCVTGLEKDKSRYKNMKN